MSEPIIVDKKPMVVACEPGTVAWCSCGKSENQPYCDGSHAGSAFRPTVVKIEESKTVAFCMCKHTQNPPYCDGTHSKL